MIGDGLSNHEGEKWAVHRKIINHAFHLEKLKVR
jgi:cytochrome P450